MCVCVCVCACFWLVWGQLQGRAGPLRRQQRRLEGAGSGALARREHLAGEMVKGVVSFWGGTDPSVRGCTHTRTHRVRQTDRQTDSDTLPISLLNMGVK